MTPALVQTAPGIRAVGLTVRYRRRLRPALDGVDLTLTAGVTALVGPNGSGKSTLMRTLATTNTAYRGSVQIEDHDLRAERARRAARARLGYLPQDFRFTPTFTVRELVTYVAWLKCIPEPERTAAVAASIEEVGLTERADSPLKSLSGGMLRRAGIAQAIVNTPSVVLLDEPTVGLDPAQRIAFRQLVKTLGTRAAVLTSTHLIEDARASADRIVVLDQGRIVFDGDVAALERFDTPSHPGDTAIERGYSAVLAGETARS